ncbi:hypothetical protein NA56DRAFT_146301 [Hyaloscypha hepaticicola]|uniref:Uncharacterized protein n=1 Tax=Hyaloscypha hepaticicola TaxID=2082293 RepID=A0A2J6QN93_9HELO|nr:hypothetical protein NA56DRAFT_146301 [Hyaloscypha hepaticicola]
MIEPIDRWRSVRGRRVGSSSLLCHDWHCASFTTLKLQFSEAMWSSCFDTKPSPSGSKYSGESGVFGRIAPLAAVYNSWSASHMLQHQQKEALAVPLRQASSVRKKLDCETGMVLWRQRQPHETLRLWGTAVNGHFCWNTKHGYCVGSTSTSRTKETALVRLDAETFSLHLIFRWQSEMSSATQCSIDSATDARDGGVGPLINFDETCLTFLHRHRR